MKFIVYAITKQFKKNQMITNYIAIIFQHNEMK